MTKEFTKSILVFSLSLFSFIAGKSQPTVNGDLSDTQYTSLSTKLNSNAGFGANIDVTEIVYYADVANSKLYIGVKGKLDTSGDNAIGVFLNLSGLTGVSAGTDLGFSGAGSYMDGQGGGTNDNFKADFQVDYMLALNPGGGTANVFIDAAKVVGGNTAEYQGGSNQSGGTVTNANVFGTGSAATFAFNNGGGANQGFEVVFDFAALGITSAMTMEAFAFVASATAFFSDVTVPGNITSGNPGFNPNFNTAPGGSFHGTAVPLPVELISFKATPRANTVILNWATASEINNSHFEVERSNDSYNWSTIGSVTGRGTTAVQNQYTLTDEDPKPGNNYYRLKQIDFDGRFEYTVIVLAKVDAGQTSVYPNPVKDHLFITTDNATIGDRIEVYSTHGTLLHATYISNNELTKLDCHNFENGIYLLNIVNENGMVKSHHRFIKH